MDSKEINKLLRDKIMSYYEMHMRSLHNQRRLRSFEHEVEIAVAEKMYELLTDGSVTLNIELIEYFLRFENPFTVMCDYFMENSGFDTKSELEATLCCLAEIKETGHESYEQTKEMKR